MSLNSVHLLGRITFKPELKYTPTTMAVCSFSVACNEVFYDKEGKKQERCEFVNVKAFAKLAENCAKFLDKGREVFVAGKLQTSYWEKDCVKHYKTEVIAEKVDFIGSFKADENAQERQKELAVGVEQIKSVMQKPKIEVSQEFTSDSIPF